MIKRINTVDEKKFIRFLTFKTQYIKMFLLKFSGCTTALHWTILTDGAHISSYVLPNPRVERSNRMNDQ